MNKIGFSKKKWEDRLSLIVILIPVSVLTLILSGIFAASPVPLAERSTGEIVLYSIMVVGLVFEVIILAWFIFHLTIGRKFYRRYMKEMIDYPDDAPVREIELTRESLKIVYEDGKHIETEIFKYSEYDIEVKVRDNHEYPVFYIWNGLIKKVVLPYSEEESPKWNTYKVLKMKRRS